MIRLIPPVAVPVRPGRVATHVMAHSRTAGGPTFGDALCDAVGRRHARLYGSGRAALTAWLSAVTRPDRDEVVVPAYTCWSVAAAIVRAGLRVRPIDLDPLTCAAEPGDYAEAVGPRTAAVIAPHLFAPTTDVDATTSAVRAVDSAVPLLEDAAQAWPVDGNSTADATLLSFGRGKPLPLGRGGALLADVELSAAPPLRSGGWLAAATLAVTALSTRPGWYRIPESLPFLGIGRTEFDPDFSLDAPFLRWQTRLGGEQLERLPRFAEARTANASYLLDALEGTVGIEFPRPAREPGPVRFPVLVRDRGLRDSLLPALRRRGVSASSMYPGTLLDIPALASRLVPLDHDFAGARALADRLLTLPVYPGLERSQLDRIAQAMQRALDEVRT